VSGVAGCVWDQPDVRVLNIERNGALVHSVWSGTKNVLTSGFRILSQITTFVA